MPPCFSELFFERVGCDDVRAGRVNVCLWHRLREYNKLYQLARERVITEAVAVLLSEAEL